MAYERLNLTTGDLLDQDVFKHIEDGISSIPNFPEITEEDFGKQLFVNKDGSGFLLLGNTHTEYWNLCYDAESLAKGVWEIGNRTPSSGTGQFDTYYFIPIKGSTTYYLGDKGTNTAYVRCINFYDIDKNFLSLKEIPTTENITSPSNAKYCTISFYQNVESQFITTISNKEDRYDKVINDSIEIIKNNWNLLEDAKGFNDNYYVNGATTGGGPSFFTYHKIPIKPKTKYYYSCNGFTSTYNVEYGARFINWYDKEEVLISTINGPRGVVTSPSNAYFCTCTFLTTSPYQSYTTKEDVELYDEPFFTAIEEPSERINKEDTYNIITNGLPTTILNKIDESYDKVNEIYDKVINEETNVKPIPNFINTLRKGIINFQFDDAPVNGDTAVKKIFDKYGYKCDFAITSNIANSTSCEVYLDFEKQGFGILSHSTDGQGYSNYTDQDIITAQTQKMYTSYDILKGAGFNIHGWVTPSSSFNKGYYNDCAKIYDYGFGISSLYNPNPKIHYFGTTTHLAQIPRVGIEGTINTKKDSTTGDLKTEIKTFLSNKWQTEQITTNIDTNNVTITNITYETVLSNAQAMGYVNSSINDGVLNTDVFNYLNDIWDVSVDKNNIVVNENTIDIIVSFKKASYRKGMKDIKELILTAFETKGLLVFYSHNAGYINVNEHGWGESCLVEILEYCKNIGVSVMNASDAIYDMYSFRYNDFLSIKK
jgi:peptidoglycan/xylan/chitin deacetylase (PgdA/CDA1 family)